MRRKYDVRKYVNTFKARGQTPVHKSNPKGKVSFILYLLQLIWPTVFFNEKSDHDVKLNCRRQYSFL